MGHTTSSRIDSFISHLLKLSSCFSSSAISQTRRMSFQDSLFKQAADELENPDVGGWELLVQLEELTVYRKYSEESGLYSYKVICNLGNIEAETCVRVYMDLEYRKKWDTYVKELYVVGGDGSSG